MVALKCMYFKSAVDLVKFANATIAAQSNIVSISYDTTTSQYVLFYT